MILIYPIISGLIIWLIYHMYWKRRNFPPGPMPLPFFGNSLAMLKDKPGYESFRRWTKEFGGVFTFWMDSEPYIIISTYEKMKETFIKDGETYADKASNAILDKFRDGKYGIVDTNGHIWKTHRRFVISTLRDFGVGKYLMQQKILLEIQELFSKFEENLGEEQNIPKFLDKSVANVINQLIFGYRFEGDEKKEEEFRKLRELMAYQAEQFTSWKILLQAYFPIFGKVLGAPSLDDLIDNFKTSFYTFFYSQIAEHREKINFDSEDCKDYAEAYLKEQRKRELENDEEDFCDKQLANVCMDLWLAGLETTTSTLSWSISYCLNNPEVIERIHEEMDKVIGSDRLVTTADKQDLPYMNAVINESQRCANIVPINLFHATSKDTVISGYSIPKGTGVIAQISTVMLDETVFPDPYTFNPQRFIDEDGKLKKVDELIPFSIGKRQCLGEGLARMELFLFLSNFFNRYQVKPSPSQGVPCIDKSIEFGVTPRKFNAILTKRHL